MHRLGERVKELTALHATARLMLQEATSEDERLAAVAALLPPAMQFPGSYVEVESKLGEGSTFRVLFPQITS